MIRRTLILTALVLATASAAQAQRASRWYPSRAERWEFTVQARLTVGQEFSGDGGSSVKLQDDVGWGFGFAYNLNQHWSLGFGFAWRTLPYVATIVDETDPDTRDQYGGNLDLSTIGVSATWNVVQAKFTPYVTGALGWTLVDTNIPAGTATGCWWDPWWGLVCQEFPVTYGKDVATFAVGLGLRGELTETFFVRGGYEYVRDNAGAVDGTSMIRADIGWLL